MLPASKIRVILIDDHIRIHQAVNTTLNTVDDIDLVAQGATGEEAVELVEKYEPDIVLMDIVMPVMSGADAAKLIHAKFPHVKILVLSSFQDDDSVRSMLDNGASGYILKNAIATDLVNTIRVVHTGVAAFSGEVAEVLLGLRKSQHLSFNLTERELEVLKLMAAGLNNGQIAERLVISQATVKFHINNVVQKLGVETRAEAIVIAAKNDLV
jgi:NarL family two-component system response regulator LiaR